MVSSSLVSRLFPPPVFDHLQYVSMEGKAWEIWSHAVTLGRQMVDTHGVVPSKESQSISYNFCWRAGGQCQYCCHNANMKQELLQSGTTPRVSTIMSTWHTAYDQISQAFPIYICILQVIKYWRWEWPGNKPRCNQGWVCVDWHMLMSYQ